MRFIFFTALLLCTCTLKSQDIAQFQGFWGYRYYVDGKNISKQQVEEKLSIYPGAANDWKRAKRADVLSWSFLAAELGWAVWSISNLDTPNGNSRAGILAGTLGLGAGAIFFQFRRKKLMQQAILSHNQLNSTTPELSFSADGIGLMLQF